MHLKVLLADDHPVVRQGLRTMLNTDSDFQVLAEASDGEEAVRLAAEHRPDVILMDMRMPNMDGIEATRRIKASSPATTVIMLTVHNNKAYIVAAVRAGASAYLLKDASRDLVVHTIRTVASGGPRIRAVLPEQVSTMLTKRNTSRTRDYRRDSRVFEELSPREREVLTLLADGCTNKEIAAVLALSEDTVKKHVQNITAKLGASDRTQAAVMAMRAGVIS